MSQCLLRARSVEGRLVVFTVQDAPIKIYENRFVLANRPNTPVLLTESVCRVMDHLPLGEGDKVLIEGKEYVVNYFKGFSFIRTSDKAILPAYLVDHYTLLSRGVVSESKIQCKCFDKVFPISRILGTYEGNIVVSECPVPVPPELIQISAGFSYCKKALFYGDVIDGRPLVMWRGRPCVERDGDHIEFPSGNLLWKERSSDGSA